MGPKIHQENSTSSYPKETKSVSLFNCLDIFGCCTRQVPTLPQHVSRWANRSRQKTLTQQRKKFVYKYNTNIPEAPMLQSLPDEHNPSTKWFKMVGDSIAKTAVNSGIDCVQETVKALVMPTTISQYLKRINDNEYDQRPQNINDYQAFFDTLDMPDSLYDMNYDEAFCRDRLAGPNPVQIQPCSKEVLAKFARHEMDQDLCDMIDKADKEKRLFAIDYSVLATLPNGKNGNFQKYSMGPMALFEIPEDKRTIERESLCVLCIQIEQITKANPNPPVFTRADGIGWKLAKTIFNSADADYHEGVVHLAHTHLVAEAFLIATYRELPPMHPLYVLLDPHFEGTAFINDSADKYLISEGGVVDKLASQDIKELDAYIGQQVLSLLKESFAFPDQVKKRNMDQEHFQAPYPYRDDGMLIWDAIYNWVTSYINIYYQNDDEVRKDKELNNWIKELRSDKGGRVGWLNNWDTSKKMLIDIVASIIFIASAQHAAVNFPQKPIMSFTPAFPLAMYQPAPQSKQLTEDDYLSYLPPLEMGRLQAAATSLLGSVFYTTLGEYDDDHFQDRRVKAPLAELHSALDEATRTIKTRNEKRVKLWEGKLPPEIQKKWEYKFLIPESIPQSINI